MLLDIHPRTMRSLTTVAGFVLGLTIYLACGFWASVITAAAFFAGKWGGVADSLIWDIESGRKT